MNIKLQSKYKYPSDSKFSGSQFFLLSYHCYLEIGFSLMKNSVMDVTNSCRIDSERKCETNMRVV